MMSENQMPDLKQFIEICAEIEQLCSDLYQYYSELYCDDPEISRLWNKTAMEEENHRKQFEMALRLSCSDCFELKSDVRRALTVRDKLVTLIQYVRDNPPELITALSKSVQMEEVLAEFHMGTAIRLNDANLLELFNAMLKADQGHQESLKKYLAILELPYTDMKP
jgi:rubrerythrin